MNMKKMAAVALLLIIVTPIGLGYMLNITPEDVEAWETKQTVNISDLLLNSYTDYVSDYTGTTNNSSLIGAHPVYIKTGATYTPYPQYTYTSHNVTLPFTSPGVSIPYTEWSLDIDEDTTIMGHSSMGVTQTFAVEGPGTITVVNNAVYFNGSYVVSTTGDAITHADTITWRSNPSGTYTIKEATGIGGYANVAYGWTLPATSGTWENGQQNTAVTFAVDLQQDTAVTFRDVRLSNTAGTVTVSNTLDASITPVILGDYEFMHVTVGVDEVTVAGLAAWPGFTGAIEFNTVAMPSVLNSLSPMPATDFTVIQLEDPAQTTIMRVDSAVIVAGSFPSTLDKTLDLSTLYPAGSYSVKINSIGVYGESIAINGESFQVDTGQIILNGRPVSLKGAVVTSTYSEDLGRYSVDINGRQLADSSAPLAIFFGGEWSLTATANILEKTTHTNMTWHAGGFGFDRENFIAAGVITAGIVFVALGLWGRPSGAKVIMLLLICGGAALAFLNFL